MDWREQELLNVEKNDYEDPQYNIPGDWIHIHSYEFATQPWHSNIGGSVLMNEAQIIYYDLLPDYTVSV
ncbi:hypothetical protein HYN89_18155, partial [Vibrio parahaemolyticus]|nr:hypothetical protein [Vibrio parahaemolyticus]